jgi:general secretion pathway protein L
MIKQTLEVVSRWLDAVAAALVAGLGRLTSPRKVKLVEENGNTFAIRAGARTAGTRVRIEGGHVVGRLPEDVTRILRGSRLELILRSDPFLFRPLELPGRAAEFLGGVVRAQIDRLTPWSAEEAVFGWSAPTEAGNERIVVTVAPTARAKIAPYVQALSELGAQSIAVFAASQGADAGVAPIKVLEHERSAPSMSAASAAAWLPSSCSLRSWPVGPSAPISSSGAISPPARTSSRARSRSAAPPSAAVLTRTSTARAAPSACWSVASTPIRRR